MIGHCENSHPDEELTYSSISIEGIQKDTFVSFNIKQVFTNTTGENTDITYYFPNESLFCTYETLFNIDGKQIKPSLREKDEAKHEFNEAKDAGRHAMFGEDSGDGLNSFKLGNLPKGKTAEIHLKVSFLADIDENGYFYKFPLSTKYQKGIMTNEYSDKPNSFHFSLKVNTQKELSDFKVSIDGTKKLIDSHNATFETNQAPKKDAIFIETPIKDEDKSIAVSSDGYIAISTNPSFSGKIESNSEFYFVVDCSGSMSGPRIINAVKCMRLFIQSLPIGCRFAILKFGTSFETVLHPCDYSDENVDKALNLLKSVNAKMGGTDILSPLQHIAGLKPQPGFVKQIFLLTDGEVDNPDVTCATALKNRNENRIFSIGLGSGADPGLIKGLAKKSGGNYIMIADEDNMNEKVITLLSSAIAPAATHISIQTDQPATEIWPSPCPSVYSNNPQSFLIKAPHAENVLISGSCSDETVDFAIPVSKCDDNLGMKQLFARYIIEDYETQILLQRNDELRKKCIQLSIESGVLSKFTAYVGIIFEAAPPPAENPAKRIARHQFSRRLHGSGLAPHMLGGASPMRAMRANARVVSQEPTAIHQFNDNEDDADKEKLKDAVPKPNVNGSWTEFENMDNELIQKYGKAVAATVAAIAFIRSQFKDKLKEYALIIKKAFAFLAKQNKDVNWEEIVNKYVKD